MIFTSMIFLIYFFPFVLFFYYIIPRKHRKLRNFVLLIFSLFFYFVGEPRAIFWMLLSIIMNYIFGVLIGRSSRDKFRKLILFLSVLSNLSILLYFKYMNFFMENIAYLLKLDFVSRNIIMPIGISFYTFQGMSYVIDVYRDSVDYQKSILNVGLYISFFPQLVAGPIVRYETIADQIENRNENLERFFVGTCRFIVGLGKKMLLANKFGKLADIIFKANGMTTIGVYLSWFGSLAYGLQIFFDFSGYSDMAIGLGKMFGFDFEENFNYPYMASSITEFWRRWHISLGSWFRDYVYIPLGGNRVSSARHIFNIFVVWSLTGFWHGASWNYIIWGLYFGVILVMEKYVLKDFAEKVPYFLRRIYSICLILIGWAIFRNEDHLLLTEYLKNMFGLYGLGNFSYIRHYFIQYYPEFLLGGLLSTPVLSKFELGSKRPVAMFAYIIILIMSITAILAGTFNPFIYFRF